MPEPPDCNVGLMAISQPCNTSREHDVDPSLDEGCSLPERVMAQNPSAVVVGRCAFGGATSPGRRLYLSPHAFPGQAGLDHGFLMRGEGIGVRGGSASR